MNFNYFLILILNNMAKHNELGKLGEAIAKEFLEQKGYRIEALNYRAGRAELDIVAKDGETLVFVEVKTRSDDFLFDPEKAMTEKKETLMRNAAVAYMRATGHDWAIRFDVIGIVVRGEDRYEVRHGEDVFF